MNAPRLTTPGIACVLAISMNSAYADNCSGYDILVNQHSDTLEVSKGHSATTNSDASTIITNDPKTIENLGVGRCTGVFLTMPDGRTAGSGFCLRKDKDGDTWSIAWELKAGADKGTWRWTAGTGKFANKTDTGWWQLAHSDGKVTITRWGGTCGTK